MEEVLFYNELYDLYSKLLTEKQKEYFEDYYFMNLSFSEMADKYSVSRNAIFKQLKITKEKLEEFEAKLELKKKRERLIEISSILSDKKIKEELEELI